MPSLDPGPTLQDEMVFEAFYTALSPRVARHVGRRYRPIQQRWALSADFYQMAVDDAVTDAFLCLRAQWDQPGFDRRTPLRLLMTIAGRRLLRFLDVILAQCRHRAPWPEAEPVAVPAPRLDRVHEVLASLHERQATVLVRHYCHGQSVAEMAQALTLSEAATQSLMQRGRQRFKTLWRADPEAPVLFRRDVMMPPASPSLGTLLKTVRAAHHASVRETAMRLGLSADRLRALENDAALPALAEMPALCDGLGLWPQQVLRAVRQTALDMLWDASAVAADRHPRALAARQLPPREASPADGPATLPDPLRRALSRALQVDPAALDAAWQALQAKPSDAQRIIYDAAVSRLTLEGEAAPAW